MIGQHKSTLACILNLIMSFVCSSVYLQIGAISICWIGLKAILYFYSSVFIYRNTGCEFDCQRSSDQMCCEHSVAQFSSDQQLNPEENLALYCKPLELYNFIRHRAIENVNLIMKTLSSDMVQVSMLSMSHFAASLSSKMPSL